MKVDGQVACLTAQLAEISDHPERESDSCVTLIRSLRR
jgi:hypothetical protein